jgi:hypothetical protein
LPKDGRQNGRDHGAKVDRSIKDTKEGAHLILLLWQRELISTKGHNTWLNATRAKSNQGQANEGDSSVEAKIMFN